MVVGLFIDDADLTCRVDRRNNRIAFDTFTDVSQDNSGRVVYSAKIRATFACGSGVDATLPNHREQAFLRRNTAKV